MHARILGAGWKSLLLASVGKASVKRSSMVQIHGARSMVRDASFCVMEPALTSGYNVGFVLGGRDPLVGWNGRIEHHE